MIINIFLRRDPHEVYRSNVRCQCIAEPNIMYANPKFYTEWGKWQLHIPIHTYLFLHVFMYVLE